MWGLLPLLNVAICRLCCVLALLVSASGATAIEKGQIAPDFELQGRSSMLKLSSLHGTVVYLDFWASWCGPCQLSFPWMNEIHRRFAAEGLRVVAIGLDQKPADSQAFLTRNSADFDVLFDPQATTPRAYGVKAMPTSVLIGRDGRILHRHSGFRLNDRAELERLIQLALAR